MTRTAGLTRREREVLEWLRARSEEEEADTLPEEGYSTLDRFTPGGWWCGSTRISSAVADSLLRMGLITSTDRYSDQECHTITEDGRHALQKRSYIPEMVRRVADEAPGLATSFGWYQRFPNLARSVPRTDPVSENPTPSPTGNMSPSSP